MVAAAEHLQADVVPEPRIVAFSLTENPRFDDLIERLRVCGLEVAGQTRSPLESQPRPGVYLVGMDAASIAEATATVEWSRAGEPQPGLIAVIANGACAERERAFIIGFDDVLTEPVSSRELAGRVRAMQRRLQRPGSANRVGFGAVTLDLRERIAWIEPGKGHHLTANETAVLRALIEARGGVMTYADVFRAAWDRESSRAARDVQAAIKRLRQKLGSAAAIETVRDVGVRLSSP